MDLKEFMSKNNVTSTTRLVSTDVLLEAEKKIGLTFGEQLKEYLLKYGYLRFKFAELYGINSNQNLDSDLIKQTLYLHKYFPETCKYIAIENQGEGDYYIVDSYDNVYEYDSNLKEVVNINQKLFEYIIKRFEEIK